MDKFIIFFLIFTGSLFSQGTKPVTQYTQTKFITDDLYIGVGKTLDVTNGSLIGLDYTDISGLGTLATQSGTFSGTSSGTNTGNVSLAGTPNYITLSGQILTLSLIDLSSHVTGATPVTNGGSGRATSTTAYGLIAAGTTATGAHQTLAAGLTTEMLVGGGTSALPVWTAATGTGSPVRASNPTITSPTISGTITQSAGDIRFGRDAAGVWSQSFNNQNQTYRLYEIDSGANDEYLVISAASGTNFIAPAATGSGTASVVRYYTTTTVWYGSGSGSPEGVHTGGIGSFYTDTTTGTQYRKTSGTGSTGWVTP